MVFGLSVLFAVAGAFLSPEPPVPEEVVFIVCARSYPDIVWDHGRMYDRNAGRFEEEADTWYLNKAERNYVQERCSDYGRLLLKYTETTPVAYEQDGKTYACRTGVPQCRAFPERIK